jgi:hypothetical protein
VIGLNRVGEVNVVDGFDGRKAVDGRPRTNSALRDETERFWFWVPFKNILGPRYIFDIVCALSIGVLSCAYTNGLLDCLSWKVTSLLGFGTPPSFEAP